MPMSPGAKRRRVLVRKYREEGAQAFRDGKTVFACPREYQGTMNEYQWLRGYNEAQTDFDSRR